MKIVSPVIKVKKIATEQSVKLVEKTIAKTIEAGNFLTNIADAFLFVTRVIKETFSRDFEFKEFLRQCFQIGYKSLPLISVTGAIMGLVLTIQTRPALGDFGAVSIASRNGGCIAHQRNGSGYYSIDMCRKNRFRYGCRIGFNESNGTD